MAWIIGVDEAGYGPNLGPLAVGATAWRAPSPDANLYDALDGAIAREPGDGRIAIADSKRLYKPGGGLRQLERAVLGALADTPRCWTELLDRLGADGDGRRRDCPWDAAYDASLPIDSSCEETADCCRRLGEACRAGSVGAPVVRARLVFPEEFNELCERHGGKGAALSHTTLALLRSVIDGLPDDDEPIAATLDKHGGRNRYAELLEHHFPEREIEILHESRPESRYRAGRIGFAFRSKGESHMPVALASMTAKLLRELSMAALNAWWAERVPDLRPTAGYPVDAKRFKADIAARQRELRVEDRVLWRNR
ncbi:hypothetical protein Mal64_16320 [Pseudobythopirellula maris]|uniref:Uncharacterized protein n=1 Tax=Pseudobythopirellula maris TaxID=2527991 RepID=A0A5C5ZLV5_9BACT|nr:hypothetical protein [Pseudobythopirellula maris]TWT88155.1 hypothetical protein Mal64_16320 [Pseudobythopirellula maris]